MQSITRSMVLSLALLLTTVGCAGNGAPATPEPSAGGPASDPGPVFTGAVTAFVGVSVVPMTGDPSGPGGEERALAGWTVLVEDDRIAAVGPAGEVEVPVGARVIEGRGRTLVPGLVDMHVHLPPDPPAAALRAATAAPARYLSGLPEEGSATGRPADFGRIEPGLRADLLLLSENPLENVAATRGIEGVMLRGRWLDRGALDSLLSELESES